MYTLYRLNSNIYINYTNIIHYILYLYNFSLEKMNGKHIIL